MRCKVTIKQCAEALKATGGFVTHAAKMLGVSSSTLSERVSKSEYLQRVVAETKAEHLDLAESTLIKKIKGEDLGAICFYLKCQGKERGYIERGQVEVSGRDGGPIKVTPPTRIEVVLVDPTKSDAES